MMKRSLRLGASLAAISALLGLASAVRAQEGQSTQAPEILDEVVVTGIRGSLMSAANLKRNSDGVVDAITAEDIGDFPDTNLAESLQRITGVSIERNNGEGNQISVRGFGPSFNLVTLNGRQMPGASSPKQESADSALQPRSFNFADLAAESVAAVEVFKTGRASLPTGGIGATVNIRTARPLELDDFVLAGSVKGLMDESNVNGEDITGDFSGIISRRFRFDNGGGVGILFNGSYSRRDSREEVVTTDGWLRNDPAANPTFAANVNRAAVNPALNPGVIYTPRNLVMDFSDHERTRKNAQLVLQFAPSDSLKATLDYTYSNYQDDIQRTQTAVWFDQNLVRGTANANGTVVNPSITSDGVNYGAFDFNGYTDLIENENKSLGFNVDWQVTDNISLNFDAHNSESHAQPDGQSSDFLTILSGQIGTSYGVAYGTGTDVPQLNFTNGPGVDPFNPRRMRPNITLGRGNEMLNEITEYNVRGNWANADSGSLRSIDFGVGYIDYSVDTNFQFDLQVFNGGFTDPDTAGFVTVIPRGGYGTAFSGSNGLAPAFVQFNPFGFQQFYVDNGAAPVFSLAFGIVNQIEETTSSSFIKFNFEDQFNGYDVRLNAGLRYEHTDVVGATLGNPPAALTWISSTELRAANAPNQELIELAGEYDVFLPAVDLSVDLNEDMVVRASYGRTLSRPDLNRLRPNLAITDTRPGGPYQASRGNADLQPYISDNLDVSFEWYYSPGSYFSVAGFKKFVDNYITTAVTNAPIFSPTLGCNLTDPSTPGVNPPAPVTGTCANRTAIFAISTVQNGEAAEVEGLEIALQHLFGDSGFGVQANYTIVRGDVEFDTASLNQNVALLGLSDSANLVAFYDNGTLQARIAYNWRDEFLQSVDQLRQPGEPVFVDAYGQIDASASYAVNDHFSIFAEGINLTDEITTAHGRYDEQFLYAYHGGTRYALGLRAKF